MSDDYYATGERERRNKGKDKRRDKKKHPYRSGGGRRSVDFSGGKKK